MRALADVWQRLRSLAGRREIEDRLDDEIRFHVEQQTEKNRRTGMAPDEARRQALIRFGGVEQVREGTRDEFRAARHRAPRARRPLRAALTAPTSGLLSDGHPLAGDRHRRERGHLRHGSRSALSRLPARAPRNARQRVRNRRRAGVQSPVAREHRGPAQGHDVRFSAASRHRRSPPHQSITVARRDTSWAKR